MGVLRDTIIHGILHITKQLKMGSKFRNIAKVEQDTVELGDQDADTKIYGADIYFEGDNIRFTGKQTILDADRLKLNDGGLMYGTRDPGDVNFGIKDIPDGTIYFQIL